MRMRWIKAGLLGLVTLGAAAQSPVLTPVSGLNGGKVIPTTLPGTLSVGTNGLRTASGGIFLVQTSFASAASFTMTGNSGEVWSLQHAAELVPLSDGSGHTLMMDPATVILSTGATGTFSGGPDPLAVGLTVNVQDPVSNPVGVYNGAFMLTLLSKGGVATQPVNITVTVDPTPISILNASDLAFGAVVLGSNGGTVVVAPGGARTLTGDLLPLEGGGAAAFTVSGVAGASYTVMLPASTTLSNGGGQNLLVDAFTSSPGGNAGLLDTVTGQQALQVGATLNVLPGQAPGQYTGTFQVTVAYN